jgi:hypothetical protein
VVRAVFLVQAAVHAYDQIKVLSNRMSAKPSHLLHQVSLKNSEGAGNNGQHVEARPAFAADQKGAQVLDDLHDLDRTFGKTHFLNLVVHNAGAVQDPHNAAHSHYPSGIGEYSGHNADEGFLFQNRVGIHHANVRTGGGVDPRVDGIGFAARCLFVENEEARFYWAAIDGVKRRGCDVRNVEYAGRLKLVSLPQLFEGAVARSVIDHNDFEAGIFEPEQSPHTAHNGPFLVVCRNDERDGWRERRSLDEFQSQAAEAMTMDSVLKDRDDQQSQVNEIRKHVVDEEGVVRNGEEMHFSAPPRPRQWRLPTTPSVFWWRSPLPSTQPEPRDCPHQFRKYRRFSRWPRSVRVRK